MENTFSLGRIQKKNGQTATTMVVDSNSYELAVLAEHFGWEPHSLDIGAMLQDWTASFEKLKAIRGTIVATDDGKTALIADKDVQRHLSPVERPGKVLCAAANYSDHAAEMAKTGFTGPSSAPKVTPTRPQKPYHFIKASSCMSGPEDDIVLPGPDFRIDWEVELAAIIGTPAKDVPTSEALHHVAGYVVVNDVSCRAATWREDRPGIRSDWLAGKSYDTFLPTGPYFLPAAFVPDYRALRLQLWVNGSVQQDGYARDMIFSLEEQIAYLSAMLTLESGDMIATGTPAGVGQGKGAFLKPDDIVEAEIPGMGRQRNVVRNRA